MTKTPRIAITLDQRTYDVISRIAHYSGASRSGYISGMLSHQIDLFEELADSLQLAAGLQNKVSPSLVRQLGKTEAYVDALAAKSGEAMDQLKMDLLEEKEAQAAAPRTARDGGPKRVRESREGRRL